MHIDVFPFDHSPANMQWVEVAKGASRGEASGGFCSVSHSVRGRRASHSRPKFRMITGCASEGLKRLGGVTMGAAIEACAGELDHQGRQQMPAVGVVYMD